MGRRMISSKVLQSDEYVDLSFEAQALYPQLILEADSFGFIVGAKRILRSIGVQATALDELEKAGFLIKFEKPYLIRHWFVANFGGDFNRIDKELTTNFTDELMRICIDQEGAYLLLDSTQEPHRWCTSDTPSIAQSRVIKYINRLVSVKESKEKNSNKEGSASSSASDNTHARTREESTDNPSAINGGNSPPPHDSIVYEDDNGRRYTLREYMVKHSSEYWKITNSTWQTAESFRKYMNDDLIRFAFDQTVGRGAESPDKYFRSVLLDYVQSGFHTEQDAIDRENRRAEPLKAKTYAEPEDFY